MQNRRKRLTEKGFTLIELLIVIAVLGILVAIAVTGFGALTKSGNSKRTKVALGNAASMFAEYDAATGLKKQPNGANPTANVWRDADPSTPAEDRLTAPESVEMDTAERTGAAVKATAAVFAEIAKMPGAKTVFSQIPPESTFNEGGLAHPILLDGWQNPILFVPAAGLNVRLGEPAADYAITSVKAYPVAGPGSLAVGVLPPGARPFFASAGPDGNFQTGDDNIYSFEN